MSRNVIMIAAIVVIAGYFYMKSSDKSQEIITSQAPQEQVAADGNTQYSNEDEILVENLIKDGIVSKIDEDGNSPKVYITADFYRIPNIDKRNIFKVMFKDFQTNNPEVTSFTVYDDKSGDEVGTYDSNGFKRN